MSKNVKNETFLKKIEASPNDSKLITCQKEKLYKYFCDKFGNRFVVKNSPHIISGTLSRACIYGLFINSYTYGSEVCGIPIVFMIVYILCMIGILHDNLDHLNKYKLITK